MNNQLRKEINAKAMLRRRHSRLKTQESWNKYHKQRNKVNKLKRQSLKIYFDTHCNKTNTESSEFWSTVKPYFTNKTKVSGQDITLYDEGKIVSNQVKVANIFNNYFVNIADHLNENESIMSSNMNDIKFHYKDHPSIVRIKDYMHESNVNTCFNLKEVKNAVVLEKFKKLNVKKACGYDGIPPRLLKAGANVLCHTFTPIVNSSITNNVFPHDLKCAEVSPLYKKKDILSKCNYRPISVLCTLSKILEGIICDQINDHFENILFQLLSAYRKKYSCENVLFRCLEEWKLALDNNEYIACIAMDLSKAFDCLPHGLLLAKLAAYGLSTNSCNYLQSYLENRKQRVKIGSFKSEWLTVKRGVPQGSLTGPLLFNIFMNDLFLCIDQKCSIFNYADDNTLSYHDTDLSNVKTVLEKEIHSAVNWFNVNFMEANSNKFQAMVMSRDSNCHINFNINGVEIPCADQITLLGVVFDKQLKFDSHVANLCKKASKRLNAMSRLANLLSEDSMVKIFSNFYQI